MNRKIRRQLAARKRHLERRIDKSNCEGCEQPIMRPGNIRYELAERTHGLAFGGLGSMRLLVQELGLAEAIDRRLDLLKIHLPYHESDHLLSNWAYMVMVSLAWNLKAWWALWLPEERGAQVAMAREEKQRVLRMEFKTFRNAIMRMPCQIVHGGRRLIYRLSSWNPWQRVLFRWLAGRRC